MIEYLINVDMFYFFTISINDSTYHNVNNHIIILICIYYFGHCIIINIRLFHKYFRFFNGLQIVKIFRIVKVHDKTIVNIFEMCSLNLN